MDFFLVYGYCFLSFLLPLYANAESVEFYSSVGMYGVCEKLTVNTDSGHWTGEMYRSLLVTEAKTCPKNGKYVRSDDGFEISTEIALSWSIKAIFSNKIRYKLYEDEGATFLDEDDLECFLNKRPIELEETHVDDSEENKLTKVQLYFKGCDGPFVIIVSLRDGKYFEAYKVFQTLLYPSQLR